MLLKLNLSNELIIRARKAAGEIVCSFNWLFEDYSSVTIERTILRLMGIDGATKDGKPLPNVIVDDLKARNALGKGAAWWIANACVAQSKTPLEVAMLIAEGNLDLTKVPIQPPNKIDKILDKYANNMLSHISKQKEYREQQFRCLGPRRVPAMYVIVATGNIYEDVTQAKAAAREGADIIAVIRSTAQSLLDYVPYGATTVGFGGTYATQSSCTLFRRRVLV